MQWWEWFGLSLFPEELKEQLFSTASQTTPVLGLGSQAEAPDQDAYSVVSQTVSWKCCLVRWTLKEVVIWNWLWWYETAGWQDRQNDRLRDFGRISSHCLDFGNWESGTKASSPVCYSPCWAGAASLKNEEITQVIFSKLGNIVDTPNSAGNSQPVVSPFSLGEKGSHLQCRLRATSHLFSSLRQGNWRVDVDHSCWTRVHQH